jgi:acyl-ACP thioesterase
VGHDELVPPPSGGRVFGSSRVVRLSDVHPSGAVRLDAIARYLQDVATDDVVDAGVARAVAWMVRRTTVVVRRRPRYGERVELATWCSGIGPALAERRTSLCGASGSLVEAVSLWVALEPSSRRPVPLTASHFDPYRESAGDRRVRSRLVVPLPPDAALAGEGRPWPLRDSDLDLYGHVNNVISWAAVEEESRRLASAEAVRWGQVEYRAAIDSGASPVVRSSRSGDVVGVWVLTDGGTVATAARVGLGPAGS